MGFRMVNKPEPECELMEFITAMKADTKELKGK